MDTAADLPHCPVLEHSTSGTVQNTTLSEISGLAASRLHPDRLWVHNDSGNTATLYLLSIAGEVLATVALPDVSAVDFEDLAIGRLSNNKPTLFVGDIGDNNKNRESISVIQLSEPDDGKNYAVTDLAIHALTYPDGPQNAEALMFDPVFEELLILTKAFSGTSRLYSLPVADLGTKSQLRAVGVLQFGTAPLIGGTTVTAGDIGPKGHYIAVRTYTHLFLWKRETGQRIETTLTGEPCVIVPESEPQGEAIGFGAEGGVLFSISEWAEQPIYRYRLSH